MSWGRNYTMLKKYMSKFYLKHLMLFLIFILLFISPIFSYNPPQITQRFVLTEKKLSLMKDYSNKFTGIDSFYLYQPKIIVIHYTATSTFEQAFNMFKQDEVDKEREKLAKYSACNVGAHFLIDSDGSIVQLYPTTIMTRHTIGFNHTAIGIENVGLTEESLTKAQLIANIELIKFLLYRHQSIQYLIGHHEYMNIKLPHYQLYKNKVSDYTPTIKIDPGFKFMARLRELLKEDGIRLKE